MSFVKDRIDADRAIVEAIRDNPDGTALARLIVEGMQQARFTGFGDWDQARYVAHLALQAGWNAPVAELAAPEDRPFALGDWALITLPAHDPFVHYSGQVGKITHTVDGEGGYVLKVGSGSLRAVAEELTLVTASPAMPAEAGAPTNA